MKMPIQQFNHCLVTSIGTLVADALTHPIELITTIVKSARQKTTSFKANQLVFQQGGLISLYKGFSTIAFTALFLNLIYSYSDETFKKYGNKYTKNKNNLSVPFISSLFAEFAFVGLMV